MLYEMSDDGTGWAAFSDDRRMRFRLARSLNLEPLTVRFDAVAGWNRITFVMLNPSTADAFQVDPTIRRCIAFATAWGGDVLEVVNLFAFRSPYPAALGEQARGARGDDEHNAAALIAACKQALVIAAWGTNGELDARAARIRSLLTNGYGVKFHHLGLTKDGWPKHPLARGRHRIPTDQQPIPW